eukprot:scaffold137667_cov105-Phaeocystis_antarctica.AAC.1
MAPREGRAAAAALLGGASVACRFAMPLEGGDACEWHTRHGNVRGHDQNLVCSLLWGWLGLGLGLG